MKGKLFMRVSAVVIMGCLVWKNCSEIAKTSMKSNLAEFVGSRIVFPDEFGINYGESSGKAGRIVVFYDTATCATCQIKRIDEWKFLFSDIDTSQITPLFIFSPRDDDRVRYEEELRKAELPYSVITDYDRLFTKSNDHLPELRTLHVFLLDRDDTVVFAGNPMHNNLLWEIYCKYMQALAKNEGKIQNGFDKEIEEFLRERKYPDNGLFFDCLAVDIGEVSVGQERTVTFTAINTREETIHIARVLTDCDCTEAVCSTDVLNPGEKCVFTAVFTPEEDGRFEKFLFISTAESEQETILTFAGTAKLEASAGR